MGVWSHCLVVFVTAFRGFAVAVRCFAPAWRRPRRARGIKRWGVPRRGARLAAAKAVRHGPFSVGGTKARKRTEPTSYYFDVNRPQRKPGWQIATISRRNLVRIHDPGKSDHSRPTTERYDRTATPGGVRRTSVGAPARPHHKVAEERLDLSPELTSDTSRSTVTSCPIRAGTVAISAADDRT